MLASLWTWCIYCSYECNLARCELVLRWFACELIYGGVMLCYCWGCTFCVVYISVLSNARNGQKTRENKMQTLYRLLADGKGGHVAPSCAIWQQLGDHFVNLRSAGRRQN